MNQQLQSWREAGRHLPNILKDFHAQKNVFKAMHEMLGEPDSNDTIKRPSFVEGQCYVIDCFLWFMARHGYTLQRSRAKLEFDSLADNIKALDARRNAMLAEAVGFTPRHTASDAENKADSTR